MKKQILTTLFTSLAALFLLVHNAHANEQESFKCPVEQVYSTGSGRSIDMDGGELEIKLEEGVVTIKTPVLMALVPTT